MAQAIVDSEFAALCPPLSAVEYEALEESVLAEGVRDALIVWDGILLDGHNRKAICDMHGLTYPVREAVGVDSREAAIAWILRNQLGRRNLSPDAALPSAAGGSGAHNRTNVAALPEA